MPRAPSARKRTKTSLVGRLLSSSMAIGAVIVAQGCLAPPEVKATELCTPGTYVFCRCADRSPGRKRCAADSRSFAACEANGAGKCVGGEIPDDRTGEELPDDYPVVPKQGSNTVNACPGAARSLAPSDATTLEGDTQTANEDRQGEGSCGSGTGANDHVYHLTPSASGRLQVKVTAAEGALAPVVYLRTTCDDVASQAACGPTNPNATAQLATNVLSGKDYYLFVDGASASKGKYTATVELTASSFCGDGEIDEGEACDDTNHTDGDGCGPDCRSINGNPPSGASCPGQPVHLWSNQKVKGAASTTATSYRNAWTAPASSCASGTNGGSDHIYALTPHASGNLTIRLTPPAGAALSNVMITARKVCEVVEAAGTGMCANASGTPDGSASLTVAVTQNVPLYVGIDGNGGGSYSVQFELKP